MRILFSFVVLFVLPFFIPEENSPTTSNTVLSEYCNARYEFCVEYPSSFFDTEVKADNGDGMIAYSKDVRYKLSMAGSKNVANQDCWNLFEQQIKLPLEAESDSRILYMVIQNDYYETAYFRGEYAYYRKLIRSGEDNIILEIQSPRKNYSKLKRLKKKVRLTSKKY